MHKYSKAWIGAAGAFGGMSPNMFRLATSLVSGGEMPGLTYVIGMSLFGVLGGGTALFFGETKITKAMALGLSLPAMFQSMTQDLSSVQSQLIVPTAYASTLEEPIRPVYVRWTGESAPKKFSIVYKFKDKERRLKVDSLPNIEAEHTAPADAIGAQAVVGEVSTGPRSNWVEFPPGTDKLSLELRVHPKLFSGLQKALGDRNAPEVEVELTILKKK